MFDSPTSHENTPQECHTETTAERLASVPTERLEAEICEFAALLAAADCHFLELIAEFDRRRGWESWGMASCAQWLSWKCALAAPAARERVRVAHTVSALPNTLAAFRKGTLSYSKVRAITRVASVETETDLLELATHSTASQLEGIVRAWRKCLHTRDLDRARVQQESRHLTMRYDDDGSLVGSFRIPPEEAPIVAKGITLMTAPPSTKAERDVSAETPTLRQRQADGLVELADRGLNNGAREGDERVMAVIEVEAHVLSDDSAGTCQVQHGGAIAAETARRLTCDCLEVRVTMGDKGEPDTIGKPTKSIPRSVRRAMQRRDKGQCVFPGCGASGRVEAHHLVHRAKGGSHDLQNLATLCKRHHHHVHEGGFTIETSDGGTTFDVHRPDGRLVPAAPELVDGHCSAQRQTTRTYGLERLRSMTGTTGTAKGLHIGGADRLDLELTVWALATRHPQRPADVSAETSVEPDQLPASNPPTTLDP